MGLPLTDRQFFSMEYTKIGHRATEDSPPNKYKIEPYLKYVSNKTDTDFSLGLDILIEYKD